MKIIRIILSIICFIFAGIFTLDKDSNCVKDKIDDVPRYMKVDIVRGGLDSKRYKKYKAPKYAAEYKNSKALSNFTESKGTKSWYNFDTWSDLRKNSKEWKSYYNDMTNARRNFLFNWEKVFSTVMPYVQNEKHESIGVIRVEPDNKTLYVHGMEVSPTKESNASYAAGVPYNLVKKYIDIPAHFMFHTHPIGINADPLPSDADIYNSLLDSLYGHFIGHVVIGEYGAIVYFLNFKRLEQVRTNLVKYYTFCYDLLNAWNAFTHSSGYINVKERITFLEKWGFDMIIIPSAKYTEDTYHKLYLPGVLNDKFSDTKYELLDELKEFIKKLEKNESNKNVTYKNRSTFISDN